MVCDIFSMFWISSDVYMKGYAARALLHKLLSYLPGLVDQATFS